MSILSRTKFRSAGIGAAMLASVFLSSAAGAQDQAPENPERDQPTIRMTLPDLTTHPLAGGTVVQRLCAEDGLGERSCDDVEVYITPPALENPIGQILHGLRRDLAVGDLDAAPDVVTMIQDVLDTQAENFDNPQSLIRLSEIQQDLETGIETQDLSVLDKAMQDLWRLILQLEDDLRSEAEKALEAAQEALREALENGASEEELRELREQAQEALENFLAEQIENAEENGLSDEEKAALEEMQALMEEMQKLMEEMGLSEEMMAEMMEQMMQEAQDAQAGQSGEQGEQQEMDYQQMLEQMQQQMQQMQDMMQNMDELQELIDEQQALRDETFEEALRDDEPEEPEEPAEQQEQQEQQGQEAQEAQEEQEPQQQGEGLSEQQRSLNERLQELMDRMRQQGMDPGELQSAREAMQRAQRDLDNGEEGLAVPDQDAALEAMNTAQQQMQQQMQQMMQGGGPESGQGAGGPGAAPPLDVPGVDNEGRISESNNPNDNLEVSPGDGSQAQSGVRDQIRRRIEEGGSSYLENLLNGDRAPPAPER